MNKNLKTGLILSFALSLSVALNAQVQNPVSWKFSARKKSPTTYELVMSATVAKPWHIYSQHTPDGGPVPTAITIASNPLVSKSGAAAEVGSMKSYHDKNFNVDVKYYSNKVDFVQTVKLKGPVQTNVTGQVEYMVCDDSQCLPPKKQSFDIKLQ